MKRLNDLVENPNLVFYEDTSSPCSHCVYLGRPNLECLFPKPKKERKCRAEKGTHHGWNTYEYKIKI